MARRITEQVRGLSSYIETGVLATNLAAHGGLGRSVSSSSWSLRVFVAVARSVGSIHQEDALWEVCRIAHGFSCGKNAGAKKGDTSKHTIYVVKSRLQLVGVGGANDWRHCLERFEPYGVVSSRNLRRAKGRPPYQRRSLTYANTTGLIP